MHRRKALKYNRITYICILTLVIAELPRTLKYIFLIVIMNIVASSYNAILQVFLKLVFPEKFVKPGAVFIALTTTDMIG